MPGTFDRPPLPSPAHVELAEYKLSSFVSDLDEITSSVEKAMEGMSVGDAVFLHDAGVDVPKGEPLDPEALVRLLVFAGDLLHDIDSIRDSAERIWSALAVEYHETKLPNARQDPAAWGRYRRSVRDWHRDEAARD